MRQLGAQSLRELCELDLSQLGPQCANRVVRLFIWELYFDDLNFPR